ncbi:Arylesterase [Durusdinium trenchii]|uniref:Arylesterase n=1 Tax=Durusdinium trenchii TaxID=1381693 RepID=A0ABP0LY19_9DINO
MKKDLHEMSMKFDRLTAKGNLKTKKDLGEFGELMLHKLLHFSGLAKTEISDACSDASWVQIQQDQATPMQLSASSGFSVDTSGPRCFVLDTIFKTPTGSLSGPELSKGAEILAADGSTVLKVASDPEPHTARGTVILEAQEAQLRVTRDHRIPLASGHLVSAAQLKVGDEVVADGVPTKLTAVDFVPGEVPVLKITFQPDLPVAVFHPRPCIHSHGHKPKKTRRGRTGKYFRAVKDGADAWSVPDTQGYLTD